MVNRCVVAKGDGGRSGMDWELVLVDATIAFRVDEQRGPVV